MASSADRSPLRKITRNDAASAPRSESAKKRLKAHVQPSVTSSATTKEAATTAPEASAANNTSESTIVFIGYPTEVEIPTKGLVESLYKQAQGAGKGDQTSLTLAGVLSLEEVLLPAVAYQEDQALKQVQAAVQRDHPDYTETVVACRKAVYDCMGAAMQAAGESRQARALEDAKRETEWERARKEAMQCQIEQQARLQEQKRQEWTIKQAKRKNELVKKLPRNQELWREVVYLMTELSKLQKEERLWKQAQERLDEQQAEVAQVGKEDGGGKEEELEETTCNADGNDDMNKVTQAVDAITISSFRIQKALTICSDIATESDRVRKELYQRYRKDHQFHGYQGVKDPKGLLHALSQSQDVE